ncbi:hypothetical protein [Epilithonimonas sp.]|uniref:hypothetical protein n=1 Tax=Epilithonimonas sp. TaxID=2894511 RepID=UPI00289E4E53|nr:hypothetical protein [Epilithonimonas sp.]
MKKNLLILLLFTFFNVFSQSYTPLLKEGNKWWVYYREGYCDFCNAQYKASYIFINGETTIDGVVYKKIYSNLYYINPYGPFGTDVPNTNNPDVLECLMREDTAAKKVYFLDVNTNTEKLLYDFSAQIGDVIEDNWRLGSYNNWPLTIDNISYGSVFGKENVKTFITGFNYKIYEGIGSQSGLFSRPAEQPFELGAFWLDCFEDTSGKSCVSQFVVLGTSENSTEKNLSLYYSKENRDFKILGNPSQDYKVSFYEATGRLSEEINTKGKQSFYLKNMVKNKILFYTITSQGKSWKGKILIQ